MKQKGKGTGKGKPPSKQAGGGIDDIMNAFGDDNMDTGFDNFEKNFNPEKDFDIPAYNNIDSQFDAFSKMLGGGDDNFDITKEAKNNNKESEDDKLLKAILGQAGVKTTTKKKNDDMEELTKALKTAEDNLKKKHGANDDAELLKGILSGGNNKTNNKKKDDGMDELNNILSMADKNLKNKDKDDMALIGKFLSKEEMGEVDNDNNKKEIKKEVKKEENKIEDKYPLQQEKIFHRINKMQSLTALEKEIDVCKMIIAYKKKNNLDSKEWENKIEQANKQLNEIKTKVENGEMDFDAYKKTIQDELNYEQKLLDVYLPKDQTSTQMQKDNIKKRINIRILVIKQELNNNNDNNEDNNENNDNEIKEEKKIEKNNEIIKEEKKPKDPNEEKAKYIDLLLQQYLSARNYFKDNELKDQEKDCINKVKPIIMAKKEIQLGNIDSLDLNSLPSPIKPEYIFGYSLEERETKFKDIIAELVKQKEEIVEKKKSYNDKLSQLKKRELEKMKDQAKQVLDSYQTKINKFDEEIDKIKKIFNDKWTPAPECCVLPQEEKIETINKDIPENTMRIHFGKTDYDKDNVILKVKLNLGEKEMTKEIKLKSEKNFDETFDWTFDKREYKSLHRKHLEVQMERSYWYKLGGTDVKGNIKVDLKNLKDSIKQEGNYKMELQSKRASPSVEISINLRTPFVDKQYETITKDVFTIKKIFPPFNPKAADIPGGPTVIPKKQDIKKEEIKKSEIKEVKKEEVKKEEIKKEIKKEVKKEEIKKEEVKKEVKKENNKVDRSMFSEEELADIDGIDYLNSLKVLEFKLKSLEDQIAKISGRTPRELLQRKAKLGAKIKLMKSQLDSGDVSIKDYISLLADQSVHNRQLFNLFKQEKDLKNAKLVAERLKIMLAEINELEKQNKK